MALPLPRQRKTKCGCPAVAAPAIADTIQYVMAGHGER